MSTVTARFTFSKSTLGIIEYPPQNITKTDIENTINKNVMYLPEVKATILRPDYTKTFSKDVDEIDAVLASEPADGDYWETINLGKRFLGMGKVWHQRNVEADWSITKKGYFTDNEGLVFWWSDWARSPSGKLYIEISLCNSVGAGIDMRIGQGRDSAVFVASEKGESGLEMIWHGLLDTRMSGFQGSDWNSLTIMFVGKNIIFGTSGFDKRIVIPNDKIGINPFKAKKDTNGVYYWNFVDTDTRLEIKGSGKIMCAFNKLQFYSFGSIVTGWISMVKEPTMIPTIDICGKLVQEGTTITPGEIFDGETMAGGGYRFRAQVGMATSKEGVTPLLFSWNIKTPQVRTTAPGVPFKPEVDILTYREAMSEGNNGQYNGGDIEFGFTCYDFYYSNVTASRGHSVSVELSPYTDFPKIKRGAYGIDIINIKRPEFNVMDVMVKARDNVKRCELSIIWESEVYDLLPDEQRRHYNIMEKLAERAGVSISIPIKPLTDPILPKSEDKKPNWQFQRGATIWECMEIIRQFSGWILYPNEEGVLVYRERPTSVVPAKFSFTHQDFQDLEVEIVDYVRTRTIVLGIASGDTTVYKKNEIIGAYLIDSKLETELGETRIGFYAQPMLGNMGVIRQTCAGIQNWYTRPHRKIKFTIPDMKNYITEEKNIWLYDVIEYGEDAVYRNDRLSDVYGKYLITSLNIEANPHIVWGTVEAMSL